MAECRRSVSNIESQVTIPVGPNTHTHAHTSEDRRGSGSWQCCQHCERDNEFTVTSVWDRRQESIMPACFPPLKPKLPCKSENAHTHNVPCATCTHAFPKGLAEGRQADVGSPGREACKAVELFLSACQSFRIHPVRRNKLCHASACASAALAEAALQVAI